jgi:hypothetical protein
MKNDIMQIGRRFRELESEFVHSWGNKEGIDIELNVVYSVAAELLSELGDISNRDEVERALVHMFLLGQITREGQAQLHTNIATVSPPPPNFADGHVTTNKYEN